MARVGTDRKDYFDPSSNETMSDADSHHKDRDEQIREAPYLPRVQIWARDSGPYTMRVGNKWFHCDELIINGVEYGHKSKHTTTGTPRNQPGHAPVHPPQKSKRPSSSRAQSFQRTRPERHSASNNTATASASASNHPPSGGQHQYDPQSLPTPKQQAERRHADRVSQPDTDPYRQDRRERRDSGTAMIDDQYASGALVPYSRPTTTSTYADHPIPQSLKPVRPTVPRRGSSRNGSYSIPVRTKGRKNVRFALPPR